LTATQLFFSVIPKLAFASYRHAPHSGQPSAKQPAALSDGYGASSGPYRASVHEVSLSSLEDQPMTTVLDEPTTSSTPVERLRTTMAAVRLSFSTRKPMSATQKVCDTRTHSVTVLNRRKKRVKTQW
jgi:hypothetical protein